MTKDIASPIKSTPERVETGSKSFLIQEISFSNGEDGYQNSVNVSEATRLSVRYKILAVNPQYKNLTIGISIRDNQGVTVLTTNSRLMNKNIAAITQGEVFYSFFTFDQYFAPGRYYVTASIHEGLNHSDGCYHLIENAAEFSVVPNETRLIRSSSAAAIDFGIIPFSLIKELPESAAKSVNIKIVSGPLLSLNNQLWVIIENFTPFWLHSEGPFPVHISYIVSSNTNTSEDVEGPRTLLVPPLEPYCSRIYQLKTIIVPFRETDCTLSVSLVQEGKFWFHHLNPDHGDTIVVQTDNTTWPEKASVDKAKKLRQQADVNAILVEILAQKSEARAAHLETVAQQTEICALLAETIIKHTEALAVQSEINLQQSEARAFLAETMVQRALQAEAIAQLMITRADMAETIAQQTEVQATQAEAIAQQTETRAILSEMKAQQAEELAVQTEAVAQQTEARAVQAETMAQLAQARADQADAIAKEAEAMSIQAEKRSQEAAARVVQAVAKTQQSEVRAAQAETTASMSLAQLQDVLATKSWRVTAPLRWFYRMRRRLFYRIG